MHAFTRGYGAMQKGCTVKALWRSSMSLTRIMRQEKEIARAEWAKCVLVGSRYNLFTPLPGWPSTSTGYEVVISLQPISDLDISICYTFPAGKEILRRDARNCLRDQYPLYITDIINHRSNSNWSLIIENLSEHTLYEMLSFIWEKICEKIFKQKKIYFLIFKF